MGIPTDEQETSITYYRNGSKATVWTSDSTVMTKLDKLVADESSPWKLDEESTIKGEVVGKRYSTLKDLISFRLKKVEKNLTDEQRKALSERFSKKK